MTRLAAGERGDQDNPNVAAPCIASAQRLGEERTGRLAILARFAIS